MRGSIRQQSKHSWQIAVYTGKGPDGKHRRHFETVRGRKGDAQRRLTELLSSVDQGQYAPSGRTTVAEHLRQWIVGYVKTQCSPRTLDAVESIAERHLIPNLGHVPLRQLNPSMIESYYSKACENLSARSVHYHHRILKQSLKYAVRRGYLGRNPCDLVNPPKPVKKPMRTLTPGELDVLLAHAASSQFYPVIYTAVSSGLRQAELLALRWRDVDLDNTMSLSVNRVLHKRRGVCEFKPPKTAHSRRRVAMTPKLAIFLRDYRIEREKLHRLFGHEIGLDDLLFGNVEGKPMDPSVLTHNFARIAKRASVESVRFHDLRHTFASLMLLQGAAPKVISEALGHASVAFTMDVYSHIIEGMQENAMALLDQVLPAGRPSADNSADLARQLHIMLQQG